MTRPRPHTLMPPLDYPHWVPDALREPPAVQVLPGAVSHLQVAYADDVGWRPLQLDLHLPAADTGRPHPVAVYAHGGSFLAGVTGMGHWTELPAMGIAVASVGYRLAAEAPFSASVEDVRAATAWIASNARRYGLDAERIALWGSSAGGYIAATVGLTHGRPLGRTPRLLHHDGATETAAPRPTAVVAHYPVTAPALLRADAHQNSAAQLQAIEAVVDFCLDDAALALADRVGAAADLPPFLLVHGDDDHRVGLGQSRRLHDALTVAGASSELLVVPGADHATAHFGAAPVVTATVDFLRRSWAARTPEGGDR